MNNNEHGFYCRCDVCDVCDVRNDDVFESSDELDFIDEESVEDSMDGDHESAFASAGFGTDESYGSFEDSDW